MPRPTHSVFMAEDILLTEHSSLMFEHLRWSDFYHGLPSASRSQFCHPLSASNISVSSPSESWHMNWQPDIRTGISFWCSLSQFETSHVKLQRIVLFTVITTKYLLSSRQNISHFRPFMFDFLQRVS
jgi:hypothetical protein